MTITCAIGCLSTTSATNVGEDKDGDKPGGRQAYRLRDHQLVLRCRCLGRPRGIGASRLHHIDGNGVRTVIVESAERFARKMLTAELRERPADRLRPCLELRRLCLSGGAGAPAFRRHSEGCGCVDLGLT